MADLSQIWGAVIYQESDGKPLLIMEKQGDNWVIVEELHHRWDMGNGWHGHLDLSMNEKEDNETS